MGLFFDLEHPHIYTLTTLHHSWNVGPNFLVNLPAQLRSAVTFPDFSVITSATSLKFTLMFALVGSIESLLSAKAVDSLCPSRPRANLDADLLATGVGNLLAGFVGGLPMIFKMPAAPPT